MASRRSTPAAEPGERILSSPETAQAAARALLGQANAGDLIVAVPEGGDLEIYRPAGQHGYLRLADDQTRLVIALMLMDLLQTRDKPTPQRFPSGSVGTLVLAPTPKGDTARSSADALPLPTIRYIKGLALRRRRPER